MKTKNIIIILASVLVVPVIFLAVILAGLLVYCKITDTVIFDIVGVTYNYDGELSAEEIRSRSGITFPSDTLFVRNIHGEGKNDNNWYYTSKELFKLPENLDRPLWHKTDRSSLERDERIFSRLFETNVIGATEFWWANWITNDFAFEAHILKTQEKYYLDLSSREALPSELESLKAKEVASQ